MKKNIICFKFLSKKGILRVLYLSILLCLTADLSRVSAQTEGSWWSNIFRTECDTTRSENELISGDSIISGRVFEIDTPNDKNDIEINSIKADSIRPALKRRTGVGSVEIHMDSALMVLSADALASVPTLYGYRVQIHFGDLETARAVRANCRHRLYTRPVYLESIAPNYSVAVGNYRDRWEAELALDKLIRLYPNALIVPSEIALPKL